MTLQDLGALGEVIGAVAVVVTLLYIAAQIRQNTRQLRFTASFAVNQALAEINRRAAADEGGFTELWVRGCADLEALTPVERERFVGHAYDMLNLAVLQHEAERNGLADVHIDYIGYLSHLIRTRPGLRRFVTGLGGPFFASPTIYRRLVGPEEKS